MGDVEHDTSSEELHDVPAEIREVSFPLAMRGYSCRVVDAYVERVHHVIAQLESDRSPRSAVRHALDRVGEQVGGILQRARESAEEITKAARDEATDVTGRAKAEAAELVVQAGAAADRDRAEAQATLARARAAAEAVVAQAKQELAALEHQAEARMQEIRADTDAVWHDRSRLLDATRETAAMLEAVATEASVRFPQPPAADGDEYEDTVVAVEPGDVAAKRKPRTASVTRLPAKPRNGNRAG
ncbi:MAG TPA: DivIVA domain-containing protein [Gaiellales bacterium]